MMLIISYNLTTSNSSYFLVYESVVRTSLSGFLSCCAAFHMQALILFLISFWFFLSTAPEYISTGLLWPPATGDLLHFKQVMHIHLQ